MTQVFTKLVNYIILLLLNWCYKFTWFLLLLLSSLHTPIKATHIFTCQHWKIWLLCHGRLANLISEPETYKANEHKLNITAHHGFGSSFLHSRCFLSTSPPSPSPSSPHPLLCQPDGSSIWWGYWMCEHGGCFFSPFSSIQSTLECVCILRTIKLLSAPHSITRRALKVHPGGFGQNQNEDLIPNYIYIRLIHLYSKPPYSPCGSLACIHLPSNQRRVAVYLAQHWWAKRTELCLYYFASPQLLLLRGSYCACGRRRVSPLEMGVFRDKTKIRFNASLHRSISRSV